MWVATMHERKPLGTIALGQVFDEERIDEREDVRQIGAGAHPCRRATQASAFWTAWTTSCRSYGLPMISRASVSPTSLSSAGLFVVVSTKRHPCNGSKLRTRRRNVQLAS